MKKILYTLLFLTLLFSVGCQTVPVEKSKEFPVPQYVEDVK
jgi:hypothetical protein